MEKTRAQPSGLWREAERVDCYFLNDVLQKLVKSIKPPLKCGFNKNQITVKFGCIAYAEIKKKNLTPRVRNSPIK